MRMARRARPKKGIHVGLTPYRDSMAWSTALKSAESGWTLRSVMAMTRPVRTNRRRSFMTLTISLFALPLPGDARNPELSLQTGQLLQIDRSHDVDYGEFARLGGDDDETGHSLALHVGVDVDVLVAFARDPDD